MLEIFTAIISLLAIVSITILWRQNSNIRRIRKERDTVVTEEHRFINFLHELGTALQHDASEANLHKTINAGVGSVFDAGATALYLYDPAVKKLIPRFLSSDFLPLQPLPDKLTSQLNEQNNRATANLASYARRSSLEKNDGILADVFYKKQATKINNLAKHPQLAQTDIAPHLDKTSFMAAPLIYGDSPLGLIAVCKKKSPPFNDNDFDIFQSLAEQSAFALGNAIVHCQAAEKVQLDRELATASEIQRVLLPKSPPDFPGYKLAGANLPARVVSGDYFDYLPITEQHLGVAIADVSGKGIAASLIMAMCRSTLRSHAQDQTSPTALLASANRLLYTDMREDMFITAAMVTLDAATNVITLTRAGHNAPLLYSARDQTISTISPPGIAIGIDSGDVFERVARDTSLHMLPGDILLLYTDGTNESLDAQGNEYGMDRLEKTFADNAHQGGDKLIEAILDSLHKFTGTKAYQHDDITLVTIERT